MINEAVNRMHSLGLNKKMIRLFMEEGKLLFSEEIYVRGNPLSYPMIGEPIEGSPLGRMVADAITYLHELDKDALPYHAVIHSMGVGFEKMDICNILYVSGNREDWPYERVRQQTVSKNISMMTCLAYNHTHPEYSDIGTCTFLNIHGGLIRRG